ncbi:hypothetical protein [Streptacidiphilus sp. PAMC 29251]
MQGQHERTTVTVVRCSGQTAFVAAKAWRLGAILIGVPVSTLTRESGLTRAELLGAHFTVLLDLDALLDPRPCAWRSAGAPATRRVT